MNISIDSPKDLKETVKGYKIQYKERTLLKKIIFIEKGLNYATLKKKLEADLDIKVTRQYLYGICTGRLTPSFQFAMNLCKVLGINNIYTIFEPNELHFPDFQSADKIEIEQSQSEKSLAEPTNSKEEEIHD